MGEEKRASFWPVGYDIFHVNKITLLFLKVQNWARYFCLSLSILTFKVRPNSCSVHQVTSSCFPLYVLLLVFSLLPSVIEEANWLTLSEDIQKPGTGFDAVICLGNSFAHLPDFKGTWEINRSVPDDPFQIASYKRQRQATNTSDSVI